VKFIAPETEADPTRKRKSRIEEQLGEAVGISFVARRAFARVGTGGGDVRARYRFAGWPWAGEWTSSQRLGADKVTTRARAIGSMGIAKLMFELGWRPGGVAGQVPLLQQRPSFVESEVEPLDQYTGGVKGPIVAALAGNRWGDPGEVRSRSGEPVRLWRDRWNRTGSTSCAGSGRVFGGFLGFTANASFRLSTADVERRPVLARRLFGRLC